MVESVPELAENLKSVLEVRTAGNPDEADVLWTDLSPGQIAATVTEMGTPVSPPVVRDWLGVRKGGITDYRPTRNHPSSSSNNWTYPLFLSSVGNGAATATQAATQFCKNVNTFPGFKLGPNNQNPWEVLDNPSPVDCISLTTIAGAGLDQLGIQATTRWSFPTDAKDKDVTPATCTQQRRDDNYPCHGGTCSAQLCFYQTSDTSNRFEGFFTIDAPQIAAFTVAPPNPIQDTKQNYYYLQVLKSIKNPAIRQRWIARETKQMPDGTEVVEGDPIPDIPDVPLPKVP